MCTGATEEHNVKSRIFSLTGSGKRCDAPPIETVQGVLLSECVMTCSPNEKCHSVNYARTLKTCELLSESGRNKGARFTPNITWAHHGPAPAIPSE